MTDSTLARRFLALDGLGLSDADLEAVVSEITQYHRALTDVVAFADGVGFVDAPTRPGDAGAVLSGPDDGVDGGSEVGL